MKTRNPSATTVRKGLGFTSWGYCPKLGPKVALVLATGQRSTRSVRTQPAPTHLAPTLSHYRRSERDDQEVSRVGT